MLKKWEHRVCSFFDAFENLVEEVVAIRVSLELLNKSLDEIKMIGNESILTEKLNGTTDDINAIYKTKMGLVSFKKAKRMMHDD